jgi:[acyl-carrier-protein] S-malonyltransferase
MDTGIVFPGISATSFSDVAKFMLINPFARKLVAIADETLGYSLIDRFREAKGDFSEYARVAFLVNCLALAQWAEESMDARPDICTGPSFGGTPAAVYSGALSFRSAVWMTARWGHHLDAYFAGQHSDVVTQSFARTPEAVLSQIRSELDAQGEWNDMACYVDHDFSMLSLRESKVDWLRSRLRSLGGMPLYTMRPPMHSQAFSVLRDEIESEIFSKLEFNDPVIPVVCDHDGSLLTTAAEIRTMLLDGIVRPVRWQQVSDTLRTAGVKKLYVSGPDSLWGRVSCITQNFEVVALKPETALRPRRRVVSVAASS